MYHIVLSKKARQDVKKIHAEAEAYLMLAFLSLRQGAKTGIRLVGRFSPLFAITVREYTIVYRVHEERGVVCVVGVV